MKCITQYKKKVIELNNKYEEAIAAYDARVKPKANKAFQEYLEELHKLDVELLLAIRREKKIPVFSSLF